MPLLSLSACEADPAPQDAQDSLAEDTAEPRDTGKEDTGEDRDAAREDATETRDPREDGADDAWDDAVDAEDTGDVDPPVQAPHPSVRGTAIVGLGEDRIALAGLEVWLRRPRDGLETPRRTTNVFGDFVVSSASIGPGDWVVCSRADGLPEACDTTGFSHDGRGRQVEAPEHLRDAPSGSRVGRALMSDGTPCVWRFPLHGVAVDTVVEATSPRGTRRAIANVRGEFVLFDVASANETITAKVRCDGLEIGLPMRAGGMAQGTLPNTPPVAMGLVARNTAGAVVETRAPDEALDVTLFAEDADADTLGVRWAHNAGPIAGESRPTISFKAKAGSSDLEALVSDGRGGFDLVTLALRDTQTRGASGRVADPDGEPVVGATIRHGELTTTTNAEGVFSLEVWAPDQPMIVSARGFVDEVVAADHAPRGAAIRLTPCATTPFSARARVDLTLPQTESTPTPATATLTAASLVTTSGVPFSGQAEACFAHVGHGSDLPLPLGALSNTGEADARARVASLGSWAWLDVRDAETGERLAFAPDKVASLELPLTEAEAASAPRVLTQAAGLGTWTTGQALLPTNGRVHIKLPAPGGVGPGVDEDYGCLRLWLGDLRVLGGPKAVRWRALATATLPQTAPVTVPVTAGLDLLGPLPARRDIKVEVLDLTSPHHTPIFEWTRVLPSGSVATTPASPLATRLPYDRCGGDLVLPPPRPASHLEVLSRYDLQDTVASDGTLVTAVQLAEAYRKSVDAEVFTPSPDAPQWFWEFNGMGTNFFTRFTSQAKLAYQRKFDLPFGRQIAIKDQAAHLLMYDDLDEAISVDQTSGGDVVNRMFAWVARGGGSAQNPKRLVFFAYRDMARTNFFDLGSGLEAVPTLCQNCHGGDHPDLLALADSVRATTKWPTTQVHAHPLPVLLDTLDTYRFGVNAFSNPALSGSYGRAALEDDVNAFNRRLQLTYALSPPAEAQLDGAYGDDVSPLIPTGATQNDAYVPPGWASAPTLYREVVRPYCRSCHMQLDGALAFTTHDDFTGFAALIYEDVCQTRMMPHAPGPNMRFWTSSNPFAPAVLDAHMPGFLGWPNTSCLDP
jgi:hypothetical protein